jgi:phage baseplate assembly protein V
MHPEDIYDLRGIGMLGAVTAVNDNGQQQTIDVDLGDGVSRTGIEVWQQAGFASNPSGDGSVAVLFALGADPANLVALHLGNPSTRFGGLAKGEAVMYCPDGTRVAVRVGGIVEIWGGNKVLINAPDMEVVATTQVQVTAPSVKIIGNVEITGNVDVTGYVADGHGKLGDLRTAYDDHHHIDSIHGTTTVPDIIV